MPGVSGFKRIFEQVQPQSLFDVSRGHRAVVQLRAANGSRFIEFLAKLQKFNPIVGKFQNQHVDFYTNVLAGAGELLRLTPSRLFGGFLGS